MDDVAARLYEEACAGAVKQFIPARIDDIRAMGREPIEVRVEGHRPDAMLVVAYVDEHSGRTELSIPLWGEGQIGSSSQRLVAHPNDVGDIVTINLMEP